MYSYLFKKSQKLWSVKINLFLKFKNLKNVNEFRLRLFSTTILFSLFFGLYFIGNPFFSLFFTLIFFVLFYEFEQISSGKIKKNQIFKILIFQSLLISFLISELFLLDLVKKYFNFLIFLIVSLSINSLYFKQYMDRLTFIISNLIIISFFSLINLLLMPNGLVFFLYLVILISTMDVFAYLGGKIYGNRKIAPKISTGKTIEGTLIGLAFTVIMSLMIKYLINFNVYQALIAGVVIAILAFLGDLLESYFKRNIGIKDSGKLIPGHGGLMDRFDGYFLILPLYNIYLISLL